MTPPPRWWEVVGPIYRALAPIPPQTVDAMEVWQAVLLIRREPPAESLEEAEMPDPRPRPTPEQMRERVRRYAEARGDTELLARLAHQ